jgi:hypothetical protein
MNNPPQEIDDWIGNLERDICVRLAHPQKLPRRRSSATSHKRSFEDGDKMAERARSLRLHPKAYRNITAERLFRKIISVYGIGPCTASAADVEKLALSALSLVVLEVPQFVEK